MGTALRLLFVCSNGDERCPYLAAFRATGFCVLTGGAAKEFAHAVPEQGIAAVVIHQDNLQEGCAIAAELKCAAPRAPLLLMRDRRQTECVLPLGVDAIYYADSRDEDVCRAAAVFLWLALDESSSLLDSANTTPGLEVDLRRRA